MDMREKMMEFMMGGTGKEEKQEMMGSMVYGPSSIVSGSYCLLYLCKSFVSV